MSAAKSRVSSRLIDYLKLEGVTHIFGIPGGGLAMMLEELYERSGEMRYVVCRQETGAAYMADGYFRASGKLGAVMVTSGPGATNALTGAMNAQAAHSAMLVMTGEVMEEFFGMGYLQEGIDAGLDVNEVYKAAVSYSAMLTSPKNAKTLIEAALRAAGGTPRQVAHLSLPVDVTTAPAGFEAPDSPARYRPEPAVASDAEVLRALRTLAQAERPLLMLGNGCREALRDAGTLAGLQVFANDWGVPVMTTADGKGVYPETDDMSLRAFGLANAIWPYYWMTQTEPAYDALMVIGSGLGELATNKWNPLLQPQGPMIQVDANPRVIARDYELAQGVAGEAGAFLRAMSRLERAVRPAEAMVEARKAKLKSIREAHPPVASPGDYASCAAPMQPAALCRAMQEVLPEGGTVVMLDAGNCVGWGLHYLVAHPGFEVHSSLDMGPMGFAVGAVVGAKLARPEAACVALTGDGAFMMQGSEISTARRNGVGAIWIVLHDDDLAMVSQGQEHFFGGDMAKWKQLYSLGHPDLKRYAEGLGADAHEARDPQETAAALEKALAGAAEGRPQVIVAHIDREAQPPYYNPLYAPPQAEARRIAAGDRT